MFPLYTTSEDFCFYGMMYEVFTADWIQRDMNPKFYIGTGGTDL